MTCQERGKVQLLTVVLFHPFPSINYTLPGLAAKAEEPCEAWPWCHLGKLLQGCPEIWIKLYEALNAQSPRMGFVTFTLAIFKPLEDSG